VVVENVERIMSEEGISPKEATAKSMEQITPALIGIGLVLSAVFGPMAFFSGSTGVIYRQFSVTVISSMLLSLLVALILTPVLCASLLKQVPKGHRPAEGGISFLRPFFRWFDRTFFRFRDMYLKMVGHSLNRIMLYIFFYLLIVAAMGLLFLHLPKSYLPDEDQGIMYVQALLPPGSTLEQTRNVMETVKDHFLVKEKDAVECILTISGQNQAGRGQNIGMAFIKLKDWKLRSRPELKAGAVADRAMRVFSQIRNARVYAFTPPAVIELGNAKGFDFQLQDRGGLGHEGLMAARNQLLGMAAKDPRLTRVRPNGLEDCPEYRIAVDWEKAGALGIPITAIHDTISIAFGSAYVNDFIRGGRVKHVDIQADAPYRMLPGDLEKLYVRNNAGNMVPYSAFATGHWAFGSPKLERYNGFSSVELWGEAAPGRSSGEAMQAMEDLTSKLPKEIGFDWTALSYQERQAGAQAAPLYAFSILIIFLCVAALYESWTVPISILLALPLGAIGGAIASGMRGMPNDVYFQIGLLTILGLTTKNAILIVQFAKARVEQGMGLIEATLEGAKLRLRPILMTSLAFGFGVMPLMLATGAGAGAQKAIGTGVFGGVVTATFLVTLFAPLFYVLIEKTFGKRRKGKATNTDDAKSSREDK
jgi:HAE1 family hydrophobic/amphiphilic exporter-1